jgi:hypothetical protein
MADTWRDIEKFYENELRKIANRCKEILEDCIQSEVYDKYQPHVYERSYQLLNNVEVEIRDGCLYVYINTGNMHYESNKENSSYPASQWTPYWVNYGHNRDVPGGTYMYDYYPTRDYMRVGKERIEKELGLTVQIMNNEV